MNDMVLMNKYCLHTFAGVSNGVGRMSVMMVVVMFSCMM